MDLQRHTRNACPMGGGWGVGGGIGAHTAFLTEAAPELRRGYVVAWQGASQFIALSVASLVGVALTALLSPKGLERTAGVSPF